VRRGDAGHRKACATLPESLARPPLRSPMRPAGGRQKRLPIPRIAGTRSFLPGGPHGRSLWVM